jgi:hypothetical protein
MLQSIVNSVKTNKFNELVYSVHLFDKINYHRVASRVRQTVDHPESPMKVVLFEYDYTKLCDVNKGVTPGRLEVIPGTGVHVQYVVHTDAFKDLMQSMFCTNPGFSWFHRNRWEKTGKPNLTRRQVVLTYTPPSVQQSTPSSIAYPADETIYNDMPALIEQNAQLPTSLNVLNPNINMLNTTFYNPHAWTYSARASSAIGY